MSKTGRKPKIPAEVRNEILKQLETPYWGQQVHLAQQYGVSPEYIRKLKQRWAADSSQSDNNNID